MIVSMFLGREYPLKPPHIRTGLQLTRQFAAHAPPCMIALMRSMLVLCSMVDCGDVGVALYEYLMHCYFLTRLLCESATFCKGYSLRWAFLVFYVMSVFGNLCCTSQDEIQARTGCCKLNPVPLAGRVANSARQVYVYACGQAVSLSAFLCSEWFAVFAGLVAWRQVALTRKSQRTNPTIRKNSTGTTNWKKMRAQAR